MLRWTKDGKEITCAAIGVSVDSGTQLLKIVQPQQTVRSRPPLGQGASAECALFRCTLTLRMLTIVRSGRSSNADRIALTGPTNRWILCKRKRQGRRGRTSLFIRLALASGKLVMRDRTRFDR